MSTLTKLAIEDRLRLNGEGQLIVSPLLTARQIGDSSIDVRLNNQFLVFKSHAVGVLDPCDDRFRQGREIQERKVVLFGQSFVLHPGTLVLGSTLEYIRMPGDLECQVEGRSSWARIGLQIATASPVEPGFRGVVTLELANVGNTPLRLRPGQSIAQLVFRVASPSIKNPYGTDRKYRCPVGPEFSRLDQDRDSKVFV